MRLEPAVVHCVRKSVLGKVGKSFYLVGTSLNLALGPCSMFGTCMHKHSPPSQGCLRFGFTSCNGAIIGNLALILKSVTLMFVHVHAHTAPNFFVVHP